MSTQNQPDLANRRKPLASLSLDLDNKWSYMKTHGDSGWQDFPSYFDILVPRVLGILDRLNLKITFFIVGQDAALEKNREALKMLTDRGHAVGNHSFNHEPWLKKYNREQVESEILSADEHISRLTGKKPRGFRGPGFSHSPDVLEVLRENGYVFDASTLPTYLGPLARTYYFWTAKLSEEEREERKELFGGWRDGRAPLRAYQWQFASGKSLLEIPVTTMPIFKTPFHLSYLIYLSRYSWWAASMYLRMALFLCKMTGTEPSFLLHPLDVLGGEEVPELSFFPGMELGAERKIFLFEKVLYILSQHFKVVDMEQHARSLQKENNLKTRPVVQAA